MKVLVKDINDKVIFESFGKIGYCEIQEDSYDFSKIETSTGCGRVMNDIKVIKTYRLINAPALHEEEENSKN